MTPDQRRIAQLEATVRDLVRKVEQIPRSVNAMPRQAYRVIVGGGNDLVTIGGTTHKGIKFGAFNISTLPSLVPVAGTTYTDGLGYGTVDGVLSWIVNATLVQSPTNKVAQTNQHVVAGQYCFAADVGVLTYSGSSTRVYVLWE